MKSLFSYAIVSLSCVVSVWALPQDFGDLSDLLAGGLRPDGREMTDGFLDPAVWRGDRDLPGDWKEAYQFGPRLVKHITAAPYLFGHVPIGVEATYHKKTLERVSIYYLEAGSFFGYEPTLKESNEGKQVLREKQQTFHKIFKELERNLEKELERRATRQEAKVEGKTVMFKRRFQQFEKDDLAMQLRTERNFYVRVDLCQVANVQEDYLRPELLPLRKRERGGALEANVSRAPGGDVTLKGIPMIYQGGRAYCGITTYLMAAQYLGLTIDPATMASVSGFRYGMGGHKMIEAYKAAAKEGRLRLSRASKVDVDRVKASIDAGLPVVVWRRYDRQRNRLHTVAARSEGTMTALPEPTEEDRTTWPAAGAPAHASVITGYHGDRNEMIFAESWGEHARGKRMRAEELEATAYYVFYFSM